ncbi:MAG: pyridoxal phosphate-dependent aminotransferase [Myxococcales bacterium]|nr:pyridoxal phosphate-dependent aminotransferase [Myxococcales bacterium]
MPSSVFEGLKIRAQNYDGRIVPFHVGDTHLDPPKQSRLGALGFNLESAPDLYKYSPPHGHQEFVGAILQKLETKNRMRGMRAANVQITMGATHALSCAVRTAMDPGEHILLLAPYWPLMRGIAHSCGLRSIEVPFSHVLMRDPGADVEALLESYLTPMTTAIYFANPNNPDGKVFTRAELAGIARVAQRHGLWVISDEVYENFVFDGKFTSIASLPGMEEQTLTVFSFSKSYGLAGIRVGYLAGPARALQGTRKMVSHTVYNVPRAMQAAALAALVTGDSWVDCAKDTYRKHRDIAHTLVQAPCVSPGGATYLFLDLSEYCRDDETNCVRILERLVDAGMLLTPGGAFGSQYQKWARMCFTSVDATSLRDAVGRLNRVLESCAAEG